MNEPPDQTEVFSAANLLSPSRNHRAEVFLEDVLVLAQAGVGVEEEHALLLQVLTDLVIDDFGLVLRGDARDQPLLLSLGDPELVVGVLDVGREVIPGGCLLLGGSHEVLDVLEVDPGQVRTPGGHRLLVEELQALESALEHPLGLVLQSGDVTYDALRDSPRRGGSGQV